MSLKDYKVLPVTEDVDNEGSSSDEEAESRPDSYEAISYVWGEALFWQELTLNDSGILRITVSLSKALDQFRRIDKHRRLWADAVCINQQDVEERSAQVEIMARIYSLATRTLVWLDPAQEPDIFAFTAVNCLPKRSYIGHAHFGESLGLGYCLTRAKCCQCCSQPLPYKTDVAHAFTAFAELTTRTWFSRLWVVQEIASARKALVFSGSHHTDWDRFSFMCERLRRYTDRNNGRITNDSDLVRSLSPLGNRLHDVENMLAILDGREEGHGNTSIITVHALSHMRCSDPRDRTFAVRAILRIEDDANLKPDYSLSVAEVYCRYVYSMLTRGSNSEEMPALHGPTPFYCLALSGYRTRNKSSDTSRPSWAPDFADLNSYRIPVHGAYDHSMKGLQFHTAPSKIRASRSSQEKMLQIAGRVIGCITHIYHDLSGLQGTTHQIGFRLQEDDPAAFELVVQWYFQCRDIMCTSHGTRQVDERLPNFLLRRMPCVYTVKMEVTMQHAMIYAADYMSSVSEVHAQHCMSGLLRFLNSITASTNDGAVAPLSLGSELLCRIKLDNTCEALAWVPHESVIGDQLCVLVGAPNPFVVRPVHNSIRSLCLLGDAFTTPLSIEQVLVMPSYALSVPLRSCIMTDWDPKLKWPTWAQYRGMKMLEDEVRLVEQLVDAMSFLTMS